jgi:hypothetical protein
MNRTWLGGCAFAFVAACAGGEDVLFDNSGKGGSGGYAGSFSGTSGSNNGGESGSSQAGASGVGGSAQGGAGQGGSSQGGAGQGGSAQGGSGGTAGSAGTGGSAGSAGNANTDAGSDAASTCTVPPLVGVPVTGQGVTLEYKFSTSPTDNSIQFIIQITGSASIPVSELEVRYYFTNEAPGPFTLDFYYGGLSGTDIGSKVQKALVSMTPVTGANAYLSYTFDPSAGTLASGGTLELHPGLHQDNYQANFNECNDYSYDPTATSLKENPRIAVFRNGTLIWGAPPVASTPDGGTDAAPNDASSESAATDASTTDVSTTDATIDQSVDDAAIDAVAEASGD